MTITVRRKEKKLNYSLTFDGDNKAPQSISHSAAGQSHRLMELRNLCLAGKQATDRMTVYLVFRRPCVVYCDLVKFHHFKMGLNTTNNSRWD